VNDASTPFIHQSPSIDLLNNLAWQRCLDTECAVRRGKGYVKAKSFVRSVPDELLPAPETLAALEREAVGRSVPPAARLSQSTSG